MNKDSDIFENTSLDSFKQNGFHYNVILHTNKKIYDSIALIIKTVCHLIDMQQYFCLFMLYLNDQSKYEHKKVHM